MAKYQILIEHVNKTFWIPDKVDGFLPKLKNVFWRKKKDKKAIQDLSFSIKRGELVGYIGENGSGKSTTIKMLVGIYPPTSGKITCLEKDPFEERLKYVKNIGVVFGNRSLLTFDIAPKYSLDLYAAIYDIPAKKAVQIYTKFAKKLKVDHLLDVPVRKLSLGERMKFEIIASLLHKPKIIFLDEPTIGLDLLAREEMILFLKTVNAKYKTTIILTTHNMDDIEELCNRVIIIDDGKKVYDGPIKKVKQAYANWKRISVLYKEKIKPFIHRFPVFEKRKDYLQFKCPNDKLKHTISQVVDCFDIIDIKIEEPQLKEIVKKIYTEKMVRIK